MLINTIINRKGDNSVPLDISKTLFKKPGKYTEDGINKL